MSRLSRHRDAGQAFPIYITVVAGLLFLALAYLAVGQAAVNRSGAQTAADAAALAAAQETRDQLVDRWRAVLLDPTKWQDIFEGKGSGDDCWRADQLAAQNDAKATGCDPGLLSYVVTVQANKPVGDSIVPGTENTKSTASARAVIKALCEPPGGSTEDDASPQLKCGDKTWDLDPDDEAGLPNPDDLFDVHLATNDEG
ncbi:pilus assembly protein TadG-related protein [Streptomyces collinus]|uniref:pilus assembly protein TadG-related protein n=1 Tax=Streptomyces collinus TaxID=42684 RepID=UPI0036312101